MQIKVILTIPPVDQHMVKGVIMLNNPPCYKVPHILLKEILTLTNFIESDVKACV